jgi:hypothetical protein
MNEKVLRHKEICDGLNELYARKNHDYGDSFHTTFVEEGLAMARIRLGDKFSRFKTLSRLSCNDRDQQQVTDESIRDTLLDLANYAIMTVLEMDAPDESHATMYAYDKPFYTVGGGISKMKAKRALCMLAAILLVVAMMLMFLTGCNRQVIDTTFSYDNAILALPDGSVISGKIESWKDYDDGDQIQVKIDGTTYLVHSVNIVLIKE